MRIVDKLDVMVTSGGNVPIQQSPRLRQQLFIIGIFGPERLIATAIKSKRSLSKRSSWRKISNMSDIETVIENLRSENPLWKHSQDANIPDEIRPYILPLNWDNRKVWALDIFTDVEAVSDFTWMTSTAWWGEKNKAWFCIKPMDVLRDPSVSPAHWERIQNADKSLPIHAVRRNGRSVIVDGLHRLCALWMDGEEWVKVKWLKPEHLPLIVTDGKPY